jgi:hypothetical protein
MINSSAPIEQQIFGRSGRGLGFITEISLIIIMLSAILHINFEKINLVIFGMVGSALFSSLYSVAQHFGFDLFDWNTRTNGIIGTLGNPNFQSSFASLALIPTLFFIRQKKKSLISFSVISCLIFSYTIYICQSTQGYILVLVSSAIFMLTFTWYKNRTIFFVILLTTFSFTITAILGMLNRGPLSSFLYKTSVKSRGEFWRSAYTATKDNPFFGVGIDSFGDVSTYYKSASDANGVNEFTDNAHNYFLHYASTGGVFLLLFYVMIILITFTCVFVVQKQLGKFDFRLTSLVACLVCFYAQALISPGTISLMVWNYIFAGSIIGLSVSRKSDFPIRSTQITRIIGLCFMVFSLFITYPLFNTDRLQLKSLRDRDALLAVKVAKSYPESSLRYSKIGVELLKSGLPTQALEVGRAAVKFNPNSISAWALVLANNQAPIEERIKAKEEILRLDPFNPEVKKIDLQFLNNSN